MANHLDGLHAKTGRKSRVFVANHLALPPLTPLLAGRITGAEANMSAIWIILAYGLAFALAIILLRFFHGQHCHWYWHVAAIALAFAIGLTPPPEGWAGPHLDLAVGSAFVFLIMWGAAAPLFRVHHHK